MLFEKTNSVRVQLCQECNYSQGLDSVTKAGTVAVQNTVIVFSLFIFKY